MPRFQIFPADTATPPIEIEAADAAHVFAIVQRLACKKADVHSNGDYSFSIRLDENGLWCIYRRKHSELGELVSSNA